MNREERRNRTQRVIEKRKEKLKYLCKKSNPIEEDIICEGQLANNNDMNRFGGGGTKIKTNTRKSCASYRHHGGYGKANQYKAHDQRQLDQEKDQDYERKS